MSQFQEEWASVRTYEERILNLLGVDNPAFADRANGFVFLQPNEPDVSVFDDGDVDDLFGNADLDWFLLNAPQDTSDIVVGEQAN